MKPILSILIPTILERKESFDALFQRIYKMAQSCFLESGALINIAWECDNKELPIGTKRNMLYAKALGEYSMQLDDDDDISDHFFNLVIPHLTGVDTITYQEHCLINDIYYTSNHSLKYDDWAENVDGFDYVRTPFYKDIIKTEIARFIPVPEKRYGEDHEWSRLIRPLLLTEEHIDKELYLYQHQSKPEDFNSRYGITETNI